VWNASEIVDLQFERDDVTEFLSLQRSLLPMAGHGLDVIIAHRSTAETQLARCLNEAFRMLAEHA
jgi:hypothetical protein